MFRQLDTPLIHCTQANLMGKYILKCICWLMQDFYSNSTNLTAPGSSYAAAAEYNATLGSSTSSGGASTSSSPTVTSDALSYS